MSYLRHAYQHVVASANCKLLTTVNVIQFILLLRLTFYYCNNKDDDDDDDDDKNISMDINKSTSS